MLRPTRQAGKMLRCSARQAGKRLRHWAIKTPRHRASLITPRPAWERESTGPYDALILAVAHRDFIDMGAAGLRALGKAKYILYDVKALSN